MAEIGPWEQVEGLDGYPAGHGLVGQGLGCTFCGSMPADDFLAAVRDGGEIVPTDKSYKLYVSQPGPGGLEAKFYTHHLSPAQSAEFWELWQAGQVRWGYPGHPYVALYLPGLP